MKKTAEQLQAELDREIAYTRKVNDRNARLLEENKELKKRLAEYEQKLSKTILRQQHIHNERGGGRKRIASAKVMERVLELSAQGLPQGKIAAKLSEELNIKIGRTTVGEIVRGKYTPPDAE